MSLFDSISLTQTILELIILVCSWDLVVGWVDLASSIPANSFQLQVEGLFGTSVNLMFMGTPS